MIIYVYVIFTLEYRATSLTDCERRMIHEFEVSPRDRFVLLHRYCIAAEIFESQSTLVDVCLKFLYLRNYFEEDTTDIQYLQYI